MHTLRNKLNQMVTVSTQGRSLHFAPKEEKGDITDVEFSSPHTQALIGPALVVVSVPDTPDTNDEE